MRCRSASVLVPLLLAAGSCDLLPRTVYVEFDRETFNRQRAAWREAGVKDYEYRFSAIGFSYYYGTIRVGDGVFVEDVPDAGHDGIGFFEEYSTIDRVFDAIEKMFLRFDGTKQSKRDMYYTKIIVEYDRINHIPTSIAYRYYCPPNLAVDGTFDYRIGNFKRLNQSDKAGLD